MIVEGNGPLISLYILFLLTDDVMIPWPEESFYEISPSCTWLMDAHIMNRKKSKKTSLKISSCLFWENKTSKVKRYITRLRLLHLMKVRSLRYAETDKKEIYST